MRKLIRKIASWILEETSTDRASPHAGFQVYAPKTSQDRYKKESEKSSIIELKKTLLTHKSIVTGVLKFFNLEEVKTELGPEWERVQSIVFSEIDRIITRYMSRGDTFFRYNNDKYAIFFSKDDPEEAQMKMVLIASDIKHRLLKRIQSIWQKIEISTDVHSVDTSSFSNDISSENSKHVLKEAMENSRPISSIPKQHNYDNNLHHTAENSKNILPTKKESLTLSYSPILNVRQAKLDTFLAYPLLNQNDQTSFSQYKHFLASLPYSSQKDIDTQVLRQILELLSKIEATSEELQIVCPVHFETLYRAGSWEEYNEVLRKISIQHTTMISFLIIGSPPEVYTEKLRQMISPLKSHSRNVIIEVPIDPRVNFEVLRACAVDGAAIILHTRNEHDKKNQEILSEHIKKSRRSSIPIKFALNVCTNISISNALSYRYDFVEGPELHETVSFPSQGLKVKFRDIIT